MQHLHIGNAQTSGIHDLFAQAWGTISAFEGVMSLLLPLRTSLLDLAERNARPFFLGQCREAALQEGDVGGRCGKRNGLGISGAGEGQLTVARQQVGMGGVERLVAVKVERFDKGQRAGGVTGFGKCNGVVQADHVGWFVIDETGV